MDLHKIEGEFKSPDGFNDEKYGQSQYDRIISCVDSWITKFLEGDSPVKILATQVPVWSEELMVCLK